MTDSRRFKRVLWVSAAALVLAACSSSSKTSSSSPTTAAAGSQQSTGSTSAPTTGSAGSTGSAAAPTGSPIVIGGICDCTSPFGNIAQNFEPYRAWVSYVNASGGINGHPIKFLWADSKSNPGVAVADVQSFVQNDHAIAIVDFSNADLSFQSYLQSKNIPVVGSGNSSNTFFTNPDFYPEGQTMDAVIYSQVAVAQAAGAKSIGVMYCAEAPTCAAAVGPFKQAGQKLGVAVTVSLKIPVVAPNYTAACVASQEAHTQALSVLQGFAAVDHVISDCTKQGYKPVWVADGLDIAPSFASTPGGLYLNVTNVPYFADIPANRTMNAAFDKYFPGLRTNPNFNETWTSEWDSGLLFAHAAKAGGLGANGSTPTSAQLVQGLNSLKGDTLDGTAPPLTFTAGQPHPVDCWFTALMKDGKASLPNGLQTTCEK
jgi:branched-chain amino acid transport system substrate-binding protein